MGVLSLYALYQTAMYALSATPVVAFGLGMVDLVLLFMGVFMTFGKIEKEEAISDQDEEAQNKEVFNEGYDAGYTDGFQRACKDMNENQQCQASGLPSDVEG
jgi:hypothetical protein